MISLELILPEADKRLCIRVKETIKIRDLKSYLKRSFGINNDNILFLTHVRSVSDEMSLSEAGLYMGSGVIIKNGLPEY